MRLLIHEKAWRRVEALMPADVEALTVNDAGEILLAGQALDADTAQPDIVWANADAFFSPGARTFMTAALKAPYSVTAGMSVGLRGNAPWIRRIR